MHNLEVESSMRCWCYLRLFTCVKKKKKEKNELTLKLFHSFIFMIKLHLKLCYRPPCSHCSFHCNWTMRCSHEDFFIFWAETLLSLVCLSQRRFLYNLTVQLQSSNFPSSHRFTLPCFNKYLLLFVFNGIFLGLLFCLSLQLKYYLCVDGNSFRASLLFILLHTLAILCLRLS